MPIIKVFIVHSIGCIKEIFRFNGVNNILDLMV